MCPHALKGTEKDGVKVVECELAVSGAVELKEF
jgi:hypothetical protein